MGGPFRSAAEREAIGAKATRLFLKAHASGADADWAEALAWVALDPAHGYAFAKVEAGWELAGRLGELPLERLAGMEAPVAAVDSAEAEREQADAPVARAWMHNRRWVVGALAAGVVGAAGSIALQLDHAGERYSTDVGERRTVRLADGSLLRLNTDSVVEVAFAPRQRRLRLVRGEASFDVAHDRARPFVVEAQGAVVRAVGTAFAVRLRTDLTEVTVTHGIVAVQDGDAPEHHVAAGRAAAVRQGTIAVTPLTAPDITRRLAWQRGRLDFDGDTLAQAVEEFNRYRAKPIVIGDPALAALRVGGSFRSDQSDEFAQAVAASFGIRTVAGNDGSLLLVPAAS